MARFGGEEFCLLVPDLADGPLLDYFEALRRRIEDLDVPSPNGMLRMTVSIGVRPATRTTTCTGLADADRRLYPPRPVAATGWWRRG